MASLELHDALIGGRQKGKRGCGAAGGNNALVACENKEKKQYLPQWKWLKVFVKKTCFRGQEIQSD